VRRPAVIATAQDVLTLAEERLPEPELLPRRPIRELGEEGLVVGHQPPDGGARKFPGERLEEDEVGEPLAGGLLSLGALPAQGIAHAPAEQVIAQIAGGQFGPVLGQAAELGLGIAHRAGERRGGDRGRVGRRGPDNPRHSRGSSGGRA
jgi:hypothetical protein